MKTLILILALITGSIVNAQQEKAGENGKITATVPNVNGTEGEVLFALYTSETFMKKQADFVALSEIKDGKATGVFENVPEGTYAVVVLHDKNGNKRMDFDSSGIPQENYGTSGNSMSYGPPNWMASKFEFDGTSKELEIRF